MIPKQTGLFFHEQTVEAVVEAVEAFEPSAYQSAVIRQHAKQFDTAVFKQKLTTFIDQKLSSHACYFS